MTTPDVRIVRKRSVRVVEGDETGQPVVGIGVARVASNGTYLHGKTDENGVWSFADPFQGTVTILVGGDGYTAETETLEASAWDGERVAVVKKMADGGSIIFPSSTGNVPGLAGSLNPIRDTNNRTYIYARNISIDDSSFQPARFEVGRPFTAEDARGNRFSLTIKVILGRTSLIEYQLLQPSPLD
jgi:hypothetical protein